MASLYRRVHHSFGRGKGWQTSSACVPLCVESGKSWTCSDVELYHTLLLQPCFKFRLLLKGTFQLLLELSLLLFRRRRPNSMFSHPQTPLNSAHVFLVAAKIVVPLLFDLVKLGALQGFPPLDLEELIASHLCLHFDLQRRLSSEQHPARIDFALKILVQ